MENLQFFLLFRLTVAVLAGFWLVRRMSRHLRAIVVRSMPIRYRVSEKSFSYQARFTTLVSVVIGTLLAGGIYWGLTYLADQFSGDTPKPTRGPDLIEDPGPDPYGTSIDTILVVESDPPPEIEPSITEQPAPVAKAQPVRRAPVVINAGTWFLQLHAFEVLENAENQQARLERRLRRPVWIANGGDEWAPYKVLVGPFASRTEAEAYRKQKRLDGFSRPLEYLRLHAR